MNPFHRIFGGLLLVLIDIHLGQIEILADFIGYFLILSALNGMDGKLKGMKGARTTALIISVLAIPQAFLGQPAGTAEGVTMGFDLPTIYHQSLGVLKLILTFYLFQVFIDWARKKTEEDLQERARKLFRFYLTAHILYYVLLPFSMNFPENTVIPLFIVGIAVMIILEIVFLVLIRSFHNEQQKMELY
ncbi:hypothetical protein LC065_13570 [Halobacillus litoralis]|uniref:hypothetical protein n=1 Tax=Halobacillus litoralis TaxID=45668 RepID=UPI001CFE70AC|nr:hypothetical protein [Halobacillus litoralis]WLR46595.1 hypothetical protein LC065_13570 [Halobacillus litoralis]